MIRRDAKYRRLPRSTPAKNGATQLYGSINILWIKMAFTIEAFAERHLADLKAAAAEILGSLHDSQQRRR